MGNTNIRINFRDTLAFLSTFYHTESQLVEHSELKEFFTKVYSHQHTFKKIQDLLNFGYLERTEINKYIYRVLKIK